MHRILVCSEQWHQCVVVTHATAAGEAILAHRPADRVEETFDYHGLDSLTAGTITDRERLGEQFRPVRDDGVAFGIGERREDGNGVAAPTCVDDDVVGAIAVAGPEDVLSGPHFREDVTGQVIGTARRVEVDLRTGDLRSEP